MAENLYAFGANVEAIPEIPASSSSESVNQTTTTTSVSSDVDQNGYVKGSDPTKPKSYAHSEDSNPIQGTAGEGLYGELNLNEFVVPYENILQKYHNPTWSFTLYTMNSAEYNLFWENPDAEVSKYVIAQSGVTGRYSINSVKMTSAGPATPALTTNYSINTATVEIVENGGMHLFDDIIVLSNELNYQKFMDVPMVLELNFVGYDQNTGVPTTIPGVNKKWGVRINTITGSASDSGATMTYTLQLTSTRTGGAMSNEDWTLSEPYNCTSATFGEFLLSLESHLNNIEQKQRGYLKLKYPVLNSVGFYKFNIADELSSMIINYDVKQSPSVGTTPSGQDGAKLFSWDAGKPISKIVDDVLDCCSPYNGTTETPRQFVNIIPLSRYVGFDEIRQNSVYQNTFYFLKYQIGDVVSKDDLEDAKFNVKYFLDNAYKVVDPATNSRKLNIKRYDYQFSGLNNEITDLDLKFDQGFNLAVVRNPSSQIDVQNTRGTHTAQTIEFGDVVYNTANREDIQKMWEVKTDLETKSQSGYVLSDEEKQMIRDTNAASEAAQGIEGGQDQMNEIPFLPQDPVYIEDYREIRNVSQEGTLGIGTGIPKLNSIPIQPENISTTGSASRRDNSSDLEMQRRLARDNYYNRSFLAKIDLKVLGDPYWLGWGDYSFIEYLKRAVDGQDMDVSSSDFHYANYLTSEAYFLLNLKPVASIDDITGVINIDVSSILAQSIYRVNKVISEFGSNGKFTQLIQGGLVIRSIRHKENNTDNAEGDSNG